MAHPGLGANDATCTQAFIDAMRAPILVDLAAAVAAGDTEKAVALQKAAVNLDKPEVQKNIQPFGHAVYDIVTAKANVTSAATDDAAFWNWVAAVGAWLNALASWQQGVALAFNNWTTATPAEAALKSAVNAVAAPGPPPPLAPTKLTARIE
jgi:hypothetical protein